MRISSKTGIQLGELLASRSTIQLSVILLFATFLTSSLLLFGVTCGYDSTAYARFQHHFGLRISIASLPISLIGYGFLVHSSKVNGHE